MTVFMNASKRFIFGVIIVMALFAVTILADRFLGLMGYLDRVEFQWIYRPNYRVIKRSIGEYEHAFRTNSQGIRYGEIPLAKSSADERRILVVGDSFVEGEGVQEEETFSSLLESRCSVPEKPIRFINAGMIGAGPLQYMLALDKLAEKYDIDGVLLCIYANDLHDMSDDPGFEAELQKGRLRYYLYYLYPRIYTLAQKVKHNYEKASYGSKERDIVRQVLREARRRGVNEEKIQAWQDSLPAELVAAANRYEYNGSILAAGLLRPDLFVISLDIDTASAAQRWRNMNKVLDHIIKRCRQMNMDLAVVFIPAPFQHDPDFHRTRNIWKRVGVNIRKDWLARTTELQKRMGKWAGANHVRYLDLTPEFRRAEKLYQGNINYPLDHHWTPLGHRVAAKAIAGWLDKISFVHSEDLTDYNDK